MTARIVLATVAGALVGVLVGWQTPAEATSCGCLGDTLHLELVSGPDVPCADDRCDSEWAAQPVLQKSDGGIWGDLVMSGQVYLPDAPRGGQ